LFLPPSPAHLNLPSFPTRRSSDLKGIVHLAIFLCFRTSIFSPRPMEIKARGTIIAAKMMWVSKMKRYIPLIIPSPPNFVEGVERSEEHTSELQSRFDLVCRLLLEK